MNNKIETVSYKELARRVGDCVLNNQIHSATGEKYDFDLFSGSDSRCYVHETEEECEEHSDKCEYDGVEICQEYIITQSGAEYLQRNTNEIVFYCEALDIYLWGVTHYGTSWDGVYTDIKNAY